MSVVTRDRYRKKLHELLSRADDQAFFQLAWATSALQSDRVEAASRLVRYPPEAATSGFDSKLSIRAWELESLIGRLLLTPKYVRRDGPNRITNCQLFDTAAAATNALRELENAEAGIYLKRFSIFVELNRIGYRHFPWQRGYASRDQLYRYAFIYGQGECAAYFERTYGVTFNDFSLLGFVLYAAALEHAWVPREFTVDELGITPEVRTRALALLSTPIASAQLTAAKLVAEASARRGSPLPTAYQPSLLRRFPAVSFGDVMCAPLPELVVARITSGVFYDLVGGPSDLRNEAGRRFEEYGVAFVAAMMPRFSVGPSSRYRHRGNPVDTPDVVVSDSGRVVVVVECKATKLTLGAQFADDPVTEAKREHEEIAKGIFQLWRYFSHARRGLVTGHDVSPDAHGVVLTLEPWLILDPRFEKHLVEQAGKLAAMDPEISERDRRKVLICSIQELEVTLARSDEDAFLRTLTAARDEKYWGWMLSTVLAESKNASESLKPFPFGPGDVLPWWKATEEIAGRVGSSSTLAQSA